MYRYTEIAAAQKKNNKSLINVSAINWELRNQTLSLCPPRKDNRHLLQTNIYGIHIVYQIMHFFVKHCILFFFVFFAPPKELGTNAAVCRILRRFPPTR